MPLVYQQNINATTKLGIWHITEQEDFFFKSGSCTKRNFALAQTFTTLSRTVFVERAVSRFPHELIRIADTKKPFLENEAYHFSISHCGDYAAVIVSKDERVGVDIELFNDKIGKIVNKFLNVEEQQLIEQLFNAQYSMLNIQLLCWSIKEAVYKWYGDGGVDFKAHINIENISINNDAGIVHCRFLKNADIKIEVTFYFL